MYYPHNVVILSSRFRYPDRRLFFTRARLFFDRLELSGWHFGKKHVRNILLDDVEQVEWEADTAAVIFHLKKKESVTLRLAQPDSWKSSLEQRLQWHSTAYVIRSSIETHTTARPDQPLHEVIAFATTMG